MKHEHKVYLETIPLDEALAKFLGRLKETGGLEPLPGAEIPVSEALGRVTAAPIWAKVSSPHYHGAAMDGVAVQAKDTHGATETSPIQLRIGEAAQWVDTGDPLPEGTNAVIMQEEIQILEDDAIEIMAPVAPWHHVRPMGEDMVATELVLPENHRLRPTDLGAVAGCGHTHVQVRRRPRVAVIPTGTELVPPSADLQPGDIVEFNSLTLAGLAEEWGAAAERLSVVPDVYEEIRDAIADAVAEYDVVVINAGSSAGSEDYTAPAVEELGDLLVHGIAIRPGHPVVLGVVEDTPVLGIPGYPVSTALTFELIGKPLIHRLQGIAPPGRPTIEATMSRKLASPMGVDEYVRVTLGEVEGRIVATPLQRGAGIIMSLVRADGLALVPRFSQGVPAGERVTVELLQSRETIENTVVAIGSHDLTLDLLTSFLHRDHPEMSLSSSNVGSLGGLTALRRGEAHVAGSHLLDEETGEYNVPYVRRLLPEEEVVLVNLVYRDQGLIVPQGNPKRIESLEDLVRDDVSFVNRQKGSGTRVLLDYKLKELGLDRSEIQGYDREEYTHLTLAAAIAGGTADVGLGVLAAARALDLDFVPLLKERYDLVIPQEYYKSPLLAPLLEIVRGDEFPREVEALGGYDTHEMGQVVAEIGSDQ